MNPFQPKRFTRQPQHPVRLDKASTVRLALNGAAPELKTNIGSKATTPWGIALVSAVDNAFQFPRDLVLQNANVVTVQALLYAPVAPSGSGPTKLFGTRGTTAGDGNRRGWEVGLDGGSLVEAQLQVMDSAGSRSTTISATGYTGADVTAKPLWATFQIIRTPGTSTDLSVWLKTSGLAETTGTATVAVPFGDDTTLLNFPEVCGQFAGSSVQSDYQVLSCTARLGLSSPASRQAFYANPWQAFIDQPRLPWFADAAGGATDTPVNPAVGTVAITGYAPTLAQTANQALTPVVGSVGITGYAPTILQPQAITAGAGTITLTGYAPTVTQGITTSIVPAVGSLALTGYAPSVAQSVNQAITPAAGTLALTGYAPTLTQTANQGLLPAAGVMSITGYAPTVTQAATSPNLTPDVGQITITGYAPSVTQSGQQASGGFFEVPQVKRRRSVKEERELLGIIPREAKQIIQAVARASVVADKTDDQAARQLAARLEQQDIEAKARYTEFMQKERDRILSRDIERALRIKQRQAELDDEESAVMLLM